ncbi:hypothetical protein NNQ28_10600 [Cronobacter dublinensis]|nr:hypothetical protein [Cronobacter dublinensis]WNY84774.1 hypothetical protein NNQ28_10600 [Cronobacter dublinensis]
MKRRDNPFNTKAIVIVVAVVLAMLFLSISDSGLATEIRTFLRALLRALF